MVAGTATLWTVAFGNLGKPSVAGMETNGKF